MTPGHYDGGDDALGFFFWPSFADAMLAVVFVLILVIFFVALGMQAGSIGIELILGKQETVARAIAHAYDGDLEEVSGAGHFRVCANADCPIDIYNDIQLQRITFSDRILFPTGRHALSVEGRDVLTEVGAVIKASASDIYKIQIEGHTDTVPAPQYRAGNLELGALRAIAVYQFLRDEVGIDPVSHLMSATTFGEYSPVGRTDTTSFSAELLGAANAEEMGQGRNRRVELLLFYRRD